MFTPVQLNFPPYDFRLRHTDTRPEIFDPVRKKWLVLTPEEWVRQHVLHWLIQDKSYPSGRLAVEKTIRVNSLSKRCDIVFYNRSGEPALLVECKAPDVAISQETFDQAARYNLSLGAEIFLLTNGLSHFCCRADHERQTYVFLPDLPGYPA